MNESHRKKYPNVESKLVPCRTSTPTMSILTMSTSKIVNYQNVNDVAPTKLLL